MKCKNCAAEIPNDSVFCPECGAKLVTKKNPVIWIIAGVILLGVVSVPIIVVNNNKAKEAILVEKKRQDSIAASLAEERARIAAEQRAIEIERQQIGEKKAQVNNSIGTSSTNSLLYGTWSGSWKNGQPHGTGTLKYNQQHLIDKRDRKKRMAAPGDYIIGEFVEGKLVQGTLYDSNNNVKASIIIGL